MLSPATANGYLRQADWVGDAVVNTEIERIQLRIRTEKDVDAIEAKASFIHDVGTKDMGFIQREDLTTWTCACRQTRERCCPAKLARRENLSGKHSNRAADR